jgi:endonuclease/exonuclease/phosphatase family metal-dependent hydrolase
MTADDRLRLLTLNIRLGAGGGALDRPAYDIPASEARNAALARAIQASAADIVALQEVRNARQAQRIAARLELGAIYAPHPASYSLDFFEWGLALLFRLKVIRNGNFSLFFDRELRSGRNGLWGDFEEGGHPVAVMNVHLESQHQVAQIEVLAERAARIPLPLVVMGDFNADPDAPVMRPLAGTLADTCRMVDTARSREAAALGTLMGDRRRIDFIFVSGDRFEVHEAGLLPPPHRGVSDHIGYYAEVSLKA